MVAQASKATLNSPRKRAAIKLAKWAFPPSVAVSHAVNTDTSAMVCCPACVEARTDSVRLADAWLNAVA
jgi:hypothetical protein